MTAEVRKVDGRRAPKATTAVIASGRRKAGEMVVTAAQLRLAPGAKVSVKPAAQAAS